MSRFNRAWTRTRIGRGLNREAEQRLKEIYRRGWEDGKRDSAIGRAVNVQSDAKERAGEQPVSG